MATSPDDYVLPPVSEAVSLYITVAGEHDCPPVQMVTLGLTHTHL